MRRGFLRIAVAGAPLLACADSPGTRTELVRDSAGVTIVDHGPVDSTAS